MTDEEKKTDEQRKEPDVQKKVDSDWKKQAQVEKDAAAKKGKEKEKARRAPLPPPDFATFINSLAVQTLIAMGQIENPVTKKETLDLDQAKYTIDLLGMLEQKTKGNLTDPEKKLLDQVLYDLRMRYVATVGG
ncbi:MAG: DUF1844 domain-containing protein [Planctomycetota bacterium]